MIYLYFNRLQAEVRISSLEEELHEKNNITQNLDDLLKVKLLVIVLFFKT